MRKRTDLRGQDPNPYFDSPSMMKMMEEIFKEKGIDVSDNSAIKTLADYQFSHYINSTPVLRLGGVEFSMEDVIKAGLVARMNVALLGDTGMGKTQLDKELKALVGGNALEILGRDDLRIKDIYRQLDFGVLKDAMEQGKVLDIAALTNVTGAINLPVITVEEINRCAEEVQNQLFNIMDGYIEINGKIFPLGTEYFELTTGKGTQYVKGPLPAGIKDKEGVHVSGLRYSVGLCSGNFGNGKFTGTSSTDRAMKDRTHLRFDVDQFVPTNENLDAILQGSSGDMRVKEGQGSEDLTDTLIAAHAYFREQSRKLHVNEYLMFRYLVKGLDYIDSPNAKNSKRVMKEVWPGNVEQNNTGADDDEKFMNSMIFPVSMRGGLTTLAYARALREYALAKDPNVVKNAYSGKKGRFIVDSIIEAFKLTGAYSGIIPEGPRLQEDFVGNPHLAMEQASSIIRKRVEDKYDLLDAIGHQKSVGKPYTAAMRGLCVKDFECFR